MKIKKIIICIFCVFFAGIIIAFPDRYIETTLKGLVLWVESVVPSLFPFAVLTAILIKTGGAEIFNKPCLPLAKFLKLPPCSPACILMSVASGYPAGSRVVAEFYQSGTISERSAEKLCYLCSTSGPLFIIGSVGSKMFLNKFLGAKICLAHVSAILLTGISLSIFSKKGKTERLSPKKPYKGNLLEDCFYGGAVAMLNCGAFICFFYTISQIVNDFNLLFPVQKLLCLVFEENISSFLCMGLIEATGGCLNLAQSGNALSVPLCGFLITFGGFSIIFQQLSYLTKAGIKPLKFIVIKFLQGAVCFLFLLI